MLCPACHTPIPADAPEGFCPACLLRGADEGPPPGRAAPSLTEVAAAFPQFEILKLIGQGGMGFVYQVHQPGLDRVVALKLLCPELGRDPAFAERFAREARVLAKLNHPNIVTVFEHGESGGFFYLLMEYVEGVNLRQAMRAGRFTPAQALAMVPGICDGIQAAHAQGIWHRDIKPENILLDSRGEVKIVDFGIARLVGDPTRDFTLTRTGAALGSAAYMAPEQHEKPHEVDHRADIYSLGVVIYEMLTGELPLGRFPAPSERAAVSARIDEIVFQTLEKERDLRQQSAAEVKTDIHRAARTDAGAKAQKPTHVAPPARLPRLVAWAIGLIVGGAAFAAAGFYMMEKFRSLGGGPAGVFAIALGSVAVVLGILCALWANYERNGDSKWPTLMGLACLAVVSFGGVGVGPPGLILFGLGVLIWALVAGRRKSEGAGAGHWLPSVALLGVLTAAVLLAGLAFMGGGDFPARKAWLLGAGGLVFVLTCGFLYIPLRSIRRRWAAFFARWQAIALLAAIIAIAVAAGVAKRFDGNWPNAHHRSIACGWVSKDSPAAEVMAKLRTAAGPYADDYQLSVADDRVEVLAMTEEYASVGPNHATACLQRLNSLLPLSVIRDDWTDPRAHATRRPSRSTVWALMSLAAVLSALAGGRRTLWLVIGGVAVFGVLAALPVWTPAGLPHLVKGPPLPPFTAAELADLSVSNMAEKSVPPTVTLEAVEPNGKMNHADENP